MRKSNDAELKKIIKEYDLFLPEENVNFVDSNFLNLSIDELSRIAEMANGIQSETAAYYTDPQTVKKICEKLPIFKQKKIRLLEPSVGVGNLLRGVINFYKDKVDIIECDVFDINEYSLDICRKLIEKEFPNLKKLKINYYHEDFLDHTFASSYDLVVGNPPFIKISGKYRDHLRESFSNRLADNTSAFFLEKSLKLSNNIVLIMPKYFLHNIDFSITRDKVKKYTIDCIIDFGESGFKGVLIETIALFIDAKNLNTDGITHVISVPQKKVFLQKQNDITQSFFPNWLIYIDKFFIDTASKMEFDIFTVFRDRQLTNKYLSEIGDIQVIRSKNIPRDGKGIINTDKDLFINRNLLSGMSVGKYLDRDDVFLSPNMTYYPRVVKKPKNTIVNGSVAIFELKKDINLTTEDLMFFSSIEFENFYRIARNNSTRSLNIDKISIFYFGKKKIKK